ncbi:MAG: hypothetical protein ACRDIZ_02400 [Actinomycetota bacterium]
MEAERPSVALHRRFEALVFDWDGTAIPDRAADAARLRVLIEQLCAKGADIAIVSGTNAANVDRQLRARPHGPGRLHLLANRGSEVFRVDAAGLRQVHRRVATPAEEAALTRAAHLAVRRLGDRGLATRVVAERLNRRKIDLIPDPEWAEPPKARIAELLEAVHDRVRRAGFTQLPEVVRVVEGASGDAGLAGARVTSDVKHVEVGLTDKSDAARWILDDLRREGIGPGLVLIAGDEMGPVVGLPGSDSLMLIPGAERATAVSVGVEPGGVPPSVIRLGGGPEAFLGLLEDQLRRRDTDVPEVDDDPGWLISVRGVDPELERAHEALLTLADGRVGTRGNPALSHPAAAPMVLTTGVYEGDGPSSALLPCPRWNLLPGALTPRDDVRRTLDLRTGMLRQDIHTAAGSIHTVSFSSMARPGVTVLRARGSAEVLPADGSPLAAGDSSRTGTSDRIWWAQDRAPLGGVAAAGTQARTVDQGMATLDRLVAFETSPAEAPSADDAIRSLRASRRPGFERLLREHRRAWVRRWEDSDVTITGDPELQRAARVALHHLMGSVAESGEAAVGARGLTGPAYRGHVFWDADVFVLPFLAATHPTAARAMLKYRLRRLGPALREAKRGGRRGARFPWESAATGSDVTPSAETDPFGRPLSILTGELEEHVVADVAWAAACYEDWSGDAEFAEGPGRVLLLETARYWASRIEVEDGGRAHIRGVMGPDEYHGPVDDNAFTNVMARWNLRRAASRVGPELSVTPEERRGWEELADALVDGFDPSTGLYEQFEGFFDLEPLVIAEVAPRRPIDADLLLGRDRVGASQVVKQADALMLHHLVPDEVAPGSLRPNLDFYEPRTAHGSSLSPGIHAALFARAGRPAEALEALRLTARIDLDDLTGTTAGGLHLGAMGSLWQALAMGVMGLRPSGVVLRADPAAEPLPGWSALEVTVRFRGARVRAGLRAGIFTVESDRPIEVSLYGQSEVVSVGRGARTFRRTDRG